MKRLVLLGAFPTLLIALVLGTRSPQSAAAGDLSGATAVSTSIGTATAPSSTGNLFDDFNYSSVDDPTFRTNGWIARTVAGWPGVEGAVWDKDGITFLPDPDHADNSLMQMTSSTDGTPANTHQTQVCQRRKFFEGTYASRVRFTDNPRNTPGDQVVETLYTISPLKFDLDPDYSEMDFEYLPNGGWGIAGHVLHMTTWKTYRPEPNWQADNSNNHFMRSYAGWHTLVIQVASGTAKYYVDGHLAATHSGKYYPRVPMSINYNLWFIRDGFLNSGSVRTYIEQVDWLYFVANTVLSPDQVAVKVAGLRSQGIHFQDSVPSVTPSMESPCDT